MISKINLIKDLNLIKEKSPLIHNLTNFVVMNNTANALLALGASPVMSHAPEEIPEMVHAASAVVVNIGTLDSIWKKSIIQAGKWAKQENTPVVFDPVGSGATVFRTEFSRFFIEECCPSVIRGNASEIRSLMLNHTETKGVDSQNNPESAIEVAQELAKQKNGVVVISGAIDYIVNKSQINKIEQGHPLMARVTGMGCTATALIAAFCAVNPNFFEAASHAMLIMGICGEISAQQAMGTGSMQNCFLDSLYSIDSDKIDKFISEK